MLAILWHQHQPYYPDDLSGRNAFPWVRLHGVKDYYGMAAHLDEVPEFHCTINLVPSLLQQILQYTDEGRSDRLLDLARMSADALSEADAESALDLFFMANAGTMIRPHKRYRELFDKRDAERRSAQDALREFSTDDLRDLQVWHNLTWFHEIAFERNDDLRDFRRKGGGWSEAEKNWLLDRQLALLGEVIPLHKKLAARGQVELTTTPFFHPILPLLWDKTSARETMPEVELPPDLESYAEDAREHLRRAVEFHTELFGEPPAGLWPSEGSVSEAVLPAIAEAGFQWCATDEEVLAASTDGLASRDGSGHLHRPEMLYRPWRVGGSGSDLQMIFRDHELSDLIGFHYQRAEPEAAAHDLLARVKGIEERCRQADPSREPLVPIILDGENCWEYYPDHGVTFLRTLYQSAANDPAVKPVRVRDALAAHPATDSIPRLTAGSWINHNFAIWIGHEEDRVGWERLHETRRFLKAEAASGTHDESVLQQAWEELLIAEGSDWFWWYGDDHSSAQDALFDQLFRTHLQNVYRLLGQTPPGRLDIPITSSQPRVTYTQPTSLLDVKIDGRDNYFDWQGAGLYVAGSERGTMTMVTGGLVSELRYGFGRNNFYLRLDTPGTACDELQACDAIEVRLTGRESSIIRVTGFGEHPLTVTAAISSDAARTIGEAACNRIFELACPREALGLHENEPVRFHIDLIAGGRSVERVPPEAPISTTVPDANFERENWRV